MNYQRALIEILIIICYWFVEKMFFMVFVNAKNRSQARIHHPSIWAILLLILTWWNLGYYYIAYPIIIIAGLGIILVMKQLIGQHEFLYRIFWPSFWNLSCLLMVISYVISIFCYQLPTP